MVFRTHDAQTGGWFDKRYSYSINNQNQKSTIIIIKKGEGEEGTKKLRQRTKTTNNNGFVARAFPSVHHQPSTTKGSHFLSAQQRRNHIAMIIMSKLVILGLLLSSGFGSVTSFLMTVKRPSSVSLHMLKGMEEYEDNKRHSFENLLATTSIKPLTASSKRVKEVELELLEHLESDDASIDPLVDLWTLEKKDAAPMLRKMEEHCSPGLLEEEKLLKELIDDYGDEWAEPMARLALIFFIKGYYDQAALMCEQALQIKPWHFEVGKLLVAVQLRQQQFEKALQTERTYALPSLNERTNNKRRKQWVQRWKAEASLLLEKQAEQAAILLQNEQLEECPVGDGEASCWG